MASGDTLHRGGASASEPLGAGNVAIPRVRNGHLLLKFPDGATYARTFPGILSRRYGGSGITVRLLWAALTATTGNVKWGAAFERLQVGTDVLTTDSFAAEKTAVATTNGTAGVATSTTIAFTNSEIDGLLVGEPFRLRIQRLGSDGSDTMTDEAQLLGIELYET
jgi:hypothetical protein